MPDGSDCQKKSVMKQRSGSCALISMETLAYSERMLLLARNSAYTVKCLSGMFQVHGVCDVQGRHTK